MVEIAPRNSQRIVFIVYALDYVFANSPGDRAGIRIDIELFIDAPQVEVHCMDADMYGQCDFFLGQPFRHQLQHSFLEIAEPSRTFYDSFAEFRAPRDSSFRLG